MNKRLASSLTGLALIVLSGVAQAQCEDMVVIVRNSIYQINGLDAFCKEFDKMKADLASMKSALSNARQENAMLRDQLTIGGLPPHQDAVALLDPVQQLTETRHPAD